MEWWMLTVPGLPLFTLAVAVLIPCLHAGERARQDRRLARLERRAGCAECGVAIRVRFRRDTCSVDCENRATANAVQ